ncbi:hypothetical protein CU669_16870 [Paramagnetospirillum kuznetsovii]|uniref:Uncharacterized protein n=1 Tax=Paramagnetospirillum kuznetsovii TaxID=2053833 RepID=A0A364NUK2_9PROT|nr:hypothetical protein [Paramagnetospirillum kuznetsovii]RAU20754.1 hypothetical protein CU669_16870 [Paramagnetospirillum kuznetsovii]
MGKHRLIPPVASINTEAEHRDALIALLQGRKPPARARLIKNYLAAIESDQQRARIAQIAEQISSEMGQRGRPPRDDAPRTSSQRTIESRQAYRDEVERALMWLLAHLTEVEQQEWATLFPKVVERGIAGMPPARGGAGEPMLEEGGMLPVNETDIDALYDDFDSLVEIIIDTASLPVERQASLPAEEKIILLPDSEARRRQLSWPVERQL